jgi:hypothetical protein
MPTPACIFCSKLQQKGRGRAFVAATKEERIEAACYRAHYGAARKQLARHRCYRHTLTRSYAGMWRCTKWPFVEEQFAQALISLDLVEERAAVERHYHTHRALPSPTPDAQHVDHGQAGGQVPGHDNVCKLCKSHQGVLMYCNRCPHAFHEACLQRHWIGNIQQLANLSESERKLLWCPLVMLFCVSSNRAPLQFDAQKLRRSLVSVPPRSPTPQVASAAPVCRELSSIEYPAAETRQAGDCSPAQKQRLLLPSYKHSTKQPPVLGLLKSWVSGQSFSVRLDRGSLPIVVKYFYTTRDRDTELSILQHLADKLDTNALQLHVRKRAEFSLYPNEVLSIRATLETRLGQISRWLGISEGECRIRVPGLLRKHLTFHHYTYTLAECIIDPTWRVVFMNAYRSSPSFIQRSDKEVACLVARLLLHCFTGMLLHHNAGVLLCDCKPGNMFVPGDAALQPIFADHGYARAFATDCELRVELQPHQALGTSGYRAPEAEPCSALHYYTAASDAFSLASSLIDVLSGSVLQSTERRRRHCEFYKQYRKWPNEPEPFRCAAIPLDLLDELLHLLADDPMQRPTLTQAVATCQRCIADDQ